MNVQCAQKCNLVHLVDKRFKGVASGVGHAAIYGRVHLATLRFGRKAAVDIAIMVMDMKGGPELLLGLDVMRKCARALVPSRRCLLKMPVGPCCCRYQATIDLGRNALLIGGEAVPVIEGDDRRR